MGWGWDLDGHQEILPRYALVLAAKKCSDSPASTPGGTQLLRVSLAHGVAQLSIPNKLTAHDPKKLRKLIEVVALDVEASLPQPDSQVGAGQLVERGSALLDRSDESRRLIPDLLERRFIELGRSRQISRQLWLAIRHPEIVAAVGELVKRAVGARDLLRRKCVGESEHFLVANLARHGERDGVFYLDDIHITSKECDNTHITEEDYIEVALQFDSGCRIFSVRCVDLLNEDKHIGRGLTIDSSSRSITHLTFRGEPYLMIWESAQIHRAVYMPANPGTGIANLVEAVYGPKDSE